MSAVPRAADGKSDCCASSTETTSHGRPSAGIRALLKKVPQAVLERFYGCGAPLPLGIDGLQVLDLGSGSGRDSYVCAALVGQTGCVTGVDMTDEQLQVAQTHSEEYCRSLGYAEPNLHFIRGRIEDLQAAGISDSSVNLVISNCVINLSPDKPAVLREVYRVLKPGGELYFSDVYSDRRIPAAVQKHEVLWGECIAGAMYLEDFRRAALSAGFADVRMLAPPAPITVDDPALQAVVGNARFSSITFRLFKLPELLESICEDYGQIAIYKGTITGHEHLYILDDHHVFQTNKPEAVCGNTAAMVGDSWLSRHFQVLGDRSTHYGAFVCGPASAQVPPVAGNASAACCG
ncbi:hypothetical protein WJX73_006538 [Symbiochloris irregularis]|uniref:Arsenite methyltransferase n=1 Tax=Symbiochloris irregularis TaxID=706552 RepID=A0AAW1NM77_9CHLO